MSGNSPPQYTTNQSESPLDLTVKRTDFDDTMMNGSYAKPMDRYPTMTSHMVSPLEYQVNVYPQYEQYDHRSNYQSAENPVTPPPSSNYLKPSPSPPVGESRSGAPSPIPYSTNSYYDASRYGDSSSFEGCALPKKRKNLWRPYDSRLAAGEVDSDSSDSTSGASSDQDFKTPQMDPVKKRKMNMIQYKANENNTDNQLESNGSPTDQQPLNNESSQHSGNQSSPNKNGETWNNLSQNTESANGYFTNMAEELAKSQFSLLNSYPETREKMLSGMKKRDIFGWGLKLSKSPNDGNEEQTELKSSPVNSSPENSQVCQDGEKTYIELQTVRTGNSPPSTLNETKTEASEVDEKSPFKIPKSGVKCEIAKSSRSPAKVQRKKDTVEIDTASAADNEKENVNNDSTVFIQTRDNVIKSYDETKNVPVKTRKGISLIDLVEEIEATAKHLEIEDEKSRNNKNRRVAALLKQCNHVKLQALDYLMANVLIQDREPQFKGKNEKVQKMLKGDKITSVNMLDVLELQVECGLN